MKYNWLRFFPIKIIHLIKFVSSVAFENVIFSQRSSLENFKFSKFSFQWFLLKFAILGYITIIQKELTQGGANCADTKHIYTMMSSFHQFICVPVKKSYHLFILSRQHTITFNLKAWSHSCKEGPRLVYYKYIFNKSEHEYISFYSYGTE